MLSSWLVALTIAVSPGQCSTCGPADGGMAFSPGMSGGSWSAGMGGFGDPYDAVAMGGGGGGDQLYPFDSPEPWLYGYFQEIPAYGGYASFRPHNYKHVLAQMDVAGRWGISPTMAYSHQWYHRYRQRAGMHPNFGTAYAANETPGYGDIAANGAPDSPAADRYFRTDKGDGSLIQAAAMERGYAGTPIPGISVPDYQLARVPEGRNAVGDEYLDRIAQMQQRIDQQTYQMQVLQQQLQNSPAGQPAYQQAAPTQYLNSHAYAGQSSAPQAGYPQSGYQELPPPVAYQQYGALAAPQNGVPQIPSQQSFPQQSFRQPGYLQAQPASPNPQYGAASASGYYPADQYQQQSASPVFVPQQFSPQYGQPVYGQQPANSAAVSPSNSSNAVQPAPILQVPAGQAYFSEPRADAASAASYQGSGFGQQMSWQQSAPQAGLVPMGQPGLGVTQAYAYGTVQPGVSSQYRGGSAGVYAPQSVPVAPGRGNAYGSGNGFVR